MYRIRKIKELEDGRTDQSIMRSKHLRLLSLTSVLCLTFVILAGAFVISDDSSAQICDNVSVYVEKADGSYEKTTVNDVSTVKEAVETALKQLGMKWEYNSENKFVSVDGRKLDDGYYWRIHQWLPLGTPGWGVMSYDSNSDSYMQTGCSYCLHVSTLSSVDGTNVYSSPNFEPKSQGYVFIRFANGFDSNNATVQNTFTSEVRKEGFWLTGYGSTVAEVLEDAVTSQGMDVKLSNYTDGNGNVLRGWIISMFGIGNSSLDNGTWAYWSQWLWINHTWSYNNWTMGYYDPAVYKYLECIYLVSTPDPYAGGYTIDKGGSEPNPDTDKIVCISNYNQVTFKSNGETIATQTVKYGNVVDLSSVPTPEAPAGKTFAGWGDVMTPITKDTVFNAQFEGSGQQFTVRYYDESKKVLIYTEKVDAGASAKYTGQPSKQDDSQYTYKFKSWSSDLSEVTSDIDVTPIYEKVAKTSHTHSWGSGAITKDATCTQSGIRTYTCSCGETKIESIPATGHQYSDWYVTKQAKCTESGVETSKCSKCGDTKTQSIPTTGHQYSAWAVTKQAKCTEPGVETSKCSKCGDTKTQSIPATGHQYSDWTVKTKAKCEEPGVETSKCSKCGDIRTQSIPATGHTWSEWIVRTEATCEEQGSKESKCSECFKIKTESIPATGHTWSEWTIDKEPTPGADGLKYRTCSKCDDVHWSKVIYKGTEKIDIKGDSSTTTVVPDGDSWNAESKIKTETTDSDGKTTATVSSDSILQAIDQLITLDDGSSKISVTISIEIETNNTKNTVLLISSDDINRLSEAGNYVMRYTTGLCTMDISSKVLSNVGDGGISLSFDNDVQDVVKGYSNVKNGQAFDITMVSGDSKIHELNDNVSVSVPYALNGIDPSEVSVWYVGESGLEKVDASYDVGTGMVTFVTDHFSQWVIGVQDVGDDSSGSNATFFIIIGVVAVAIIAAIAVFIKRR